jgi:hypothetical protein
LANSIAFQDQSAEIANSGDVDTDFVHEPSLSVENEEDIFGINCSVSQDLLKG